MRLLTAVYGVQGVCMRRRVRWNCHNFTWSSPIAFSHAKPGTSSGRYGKRTVREKWAYILRTWMSLESRRETRLWRVSVYPVSYLCSMAVSYMQPPGLCLHLTMNSHVLYNGWSTRECGSATSIKTLKASTNMVSLLPTAFTILCQLKL